MKALVEVMARALVDQPDQIVIEETETETEISYTLSVAPEDMGKVIGRQGKIAKAMRTVLKAAAGKEQKRVNLDIIDKVAAE
ncbi:MAG TPA: KH domain-containing protein [Bacillota bacterium]|nr:KH domain-containing protein [Bacillota bacterium]